MSPGAPPDGPVLVSLHPSFLWSLSTIESGCGSGSEGPLLAPTPFVGSLILTVGPPVQTRYRYYSTDLLKLLYVVLDPAVLAGLPGASRVLSMVDPVSVGPVLFLLVVLQSSPSSGCTFTCC